MVKPNILSKMVAEACGTFFLVLFGTGVVANAVITNSMNGLWQVASVWGFGIAIAIYGVAGISGAHLNPAITLAFTILRPNDFPAIDCLPYMIGQLGGAFGAGIAVMTLYGPAITRLEVATGHSKTSAMMFGEYFPNPGISVWQQDDVSPLHAVFIEAAGTMILTFFICSLTDKRNKSRPNDEMVPFFIGFTLAILIAIFAPLTQAGFNPARDFGPRMVCWIGGWGPVALEGFWVYIVGPFIGAPLGMVIHDKIAANVWYFEESAEARILHDETADEDVDLS